MNKTFLFLDDMRDPYEVGNYFYPVEKRNMYRKEDWDVVRNYDSFVEYIEVNGLPDVISFDHDLADEHYAPEEYWADIVVNRKYQDEAYKHYKEKTGLDCAKWLIEYCNENKRALPEIYCHSMNPVGKTNILKTFNLI